MAAKAVTVILTTIDALAVGHNLRALARDKRTPPGVREFFTRVGDQLVSAANVAMKES